MDRNNQVHSGRSILIGCGFLLRITDRSLMLIWCCGGIIVIVINVIVVAIRFMAQNVSDGKTFNAIQWGSLLSRWCWYGYWCGRRRWWWRYWAFMCICNAFETFQWSKIIIPVASTIVFRMLLLWLLLVGFRWWWTWCAHGNFRSGWTRRRWWIRCTQHFDSSPQRKHTLHTNRLEKYCEEKLFGLRFHFTWTDTSFDQFLFFHQIIEQTLLKFRPSKTVNSVSFFPVFGRIIFTNWLITHTWIITNQST